MEPLEGFGYCRVHFDDAGKAMFPSEVAGLVEAASSATDVILVSHGFRNNEADATALYASLLASLRPQVRTLMPARRFLVAGIYWNSKAFPEDVNLNELRETVSEPAQKSALDAAGQVLARPAFDHPAQCEFVSHVISVLDSAKAETSEGLDLVRSKDGAEILKALGPGTMLGAVGRFLNMTTWYVMKNRAGVVGAQGVADVVRQLRGVRIHLAGHSLGGRLMASCAKSLAATGEKIDSMTLLEAAFSHYGFSPNNGHGLAGNFRDVIAKQVVRGPLLSTYSAMDEVVGKVYAIASRLAHDNVKAIGDSHDEFGGIGRNGALRTPESVFLELHQAGAAYSFAAGKVTNLDGSDGLIRSHGDVTNPNVTWALASAMAATQ